MADLAAKSKSDVQVFENSEFGKLEVIEIDGKPYFPATECAKALGYANTKDAVLRHCKGVVKRDLPTNGGVQVVNLIPEGDLYRLIIRSQLPAAERFERWVCDEVLPAIRKHGAYVTPSLIDQMLADPDTMIRLLTELKEERAKSTALADKVKEQAIELNESERYWTIAKYNRMNKLGWSLDACKKAGKEASRYARLHNYQIKRCETNDERFGWVNSYPLDMLKILFKK